MTLLSFPKCGRTWLKLMTYAACDVGFHISHKGPKPDRLYFLLTRHPFDVAVSRYHHCHSRFLPPHAEHFAGTLAEFIETEFHPILQRYRHFYHHRDQIVDWARYEDMVLRPEKVLIQFLTSLGVTDFSKVPEAVEMNRFELLQAQESDYCGDARKFRVGKIGNHRTELDSDSLEFMRTTLAEYDPREVWGYV